MLDLVPATVVHCGGERPGCQPVVQCLAYKKAAQAGPQDVTHDTRGRPLEGLRSTATRVWKARLSRPAWNTCSAVPRERQRPASSSRNQSASSAARFSSWVTMTTAKPSETAR